MAVGTAETSSGTSTDATAVQGRSLKAIVWGRLKRDRTAVISMVGLSVILLTAIFAPLITRLIGDLAYTLLNPRVRHN